MANESAQGVDNKGWVKNTAQYGGATIGAPVLCGISLMGYFATAAACLPAISPETKVQLCAWPPQGV